MWQHDGHDIVMLTPNEEKPGARFGPHCITCDELMIWFTIPGVKDIKKAKEDLQQRLEQYPELAQYMK